MPSTLASLTAVLASLAAVQATPLLRSHSPRDVLTALPEKADETELKFQPRVDFDSDGCYQTAAVDPEGTYNRGHDATGTPQGDCRDPHQLDNSNTYSRRRCNNGVCAVMYEYYFEKDQGARGSFLGGHRHDWENVVVFSRGDDVVRVAPSCHGKYENARNAADDVKLVDGTHTQVVYHKDGVGTHCFRFANDDDIRDAENPTGAFFSAPLVGWNGWPSAEFRDGAMGHDWGSASPKLPDGAFARTLQSAAGDSVEGFDPNVDE